MVIAARQQLGMRVRKLRRGQNLSLRKFADMIGISKDYLVDIEFGRKSPTLDTLVKISWGFGITLSDLLEGVGANLDEPVDQSDDSNTTARYFGRSF